MLFLSSFCFALLAGSGHALNLLIDDSCKDQNLAVSTALGEAIKMATVAYARLGSSTDTDFANVYQRIFSTDKSDLPSLTQVQSEFMHI